MTGGAKPWEYSFADRDRFKERSRQHEQVPAERSSHAVPLPRPAAEGRCARGDWCAGRTVVLEGGVRVVTPAATPRAYCDGCQDHITACIEEMPRLYGDLHHELGEQHSPGDGVPVHVPFGPSIPLDLAIDAHMRAMTETLASWEDRIRDLASLSDMPGASKPQDDPGDLQRSVDILAERVSMLLSLEKQEMIRFLPPWTVREEDQDAEILAGDRWTVKITAMLGGRRAGEEVMHLHYMARRLLLETSPPMPLLPDFRCRACEQKLLRAAPAPWHEDGIWYHSRCDGCGDECTREDYDVNAKRWIAYERAHLERPVLAGLSEVA